MKLFYSKGACSLVVRIIINELGLKCDFESVNLKTKQTETDKDFYTINPKGSVPTLQLDSGEILTENAIILQYLAENAKVTSLLPVQGDMKRYRVLEWLNYITTEIHKGFGPLFNPSVPKEIQESVFIPLLKKKFDYVNAELANKSYLMGESFTLPDAYLFVMLMWTAHFKMDMKEWVHLAKYQTLLKQRESILKSLEQEGFHK